jgi:microcystin-dependent protein
MSKTDGVDPNVPAGGETPRLGNDRIQDLAKAVAELIGVDHYMGADGGADVGYNEDAAGEHKQVKINAPIATPTKVANKLFFYGKDFNSKIEGCILDEDGNEVQLTTAGSIKKSVIEDSAFCPTGVIMAYGAAAAPTGWLLCDASAVSRTTYADLFAIIGTTYGVGDGSTTFNLPDLRGRVPVGLDAVNVNLAAADALAETGGEENHTLSTAEMPAHNHETTKHQGGALSVDAPIFQTATGDEARAGNTADTGGGGAHNNLQPYLTINYIVKT